MFFASQEGSMMFARKLVRSVMAVALLMSVTRPEFIGDAPGADPPGGNTKLMVQAPKDWKPTRFSDSVIFYDAPDLKKGEHCRISVFSRTEISTFKEWFARVQAPETVIEESQLVEGKSKGGYATLRLSKVVELPSGKAYRLYYALQDGKRYALILCTASSEGLLKAAVKRAEGVADSWDYSAEFPTARMLTVGASVVQVRLPAQDITLLYVEAAGGFTVKLEAKDGTVEGKKYYIGDGAVAIDLVADPADGIFLQGVKYRQGDQFKNGSTIKVRPGYKKASDLKPGDVYVTLPGVTFELPAR
jgi:hypothetical protein